MSNCSTCGSAGSCHSKGSGTCPSELIAQQDKEIAATLSHIKHKIFVMSGKGGVGKSSVAVNIACAMSQLGYKVGILDVDVHGPSVPNLLGIQKATIEVNEKQQLLPAMYADKIGVVSMDTLLQDKDQAIIWRGPKVAGAIRQFIGDVAWGPLDFLVIDSPPGTGDEHLTILQSIPDAECVVVTTPQEISLADVRKCINFIQVTKAPCLGVIENMSGLICPHCGQEIDIFKKGGGEKLAKAEHLNFLGAIPLDPKTVVAADNGVPVVETDGESPAKTAFLNVANNIVNAAVAREKK